MLDPHTLQYWYLFDKEDKPLKACWLAPPEFENTFHCRFDTCVVNNNDCFKGVCPNVFATQQDLDMHREREHRWICFMCQTESSYDTYPRCAVCGGSPADISADMFEKLLEERSQERIQALQVAELRDREKAKREERRRRAKEIREQKIRERREALERKRSAPVQVELNSEPLEEQLPTPSSVVESSVSNNPTVAKEQQIQKNIILERMKHARDLIRASELTIAPSDGFGTISLYGGEAVYQGEMKNGKFHGSGTVHRLNGDMFAGRFFKGMKHGDGKFIGADGSIYEGSYSFGYRSGSGFETCSDGTTYIGMFVRGQRCGTGKLTFPNGDTYTGQFESNKFEGTSMCQEKFTLTTNDLFPLYLERLA